MRFTTVAKGYVYLRTLGIEPPPFYER